MEETEKNRIKNENQNKENNRGTENQNQNDLSNKIEKHEIQNEDEKSFEESKNKKEKNLFDNEKKSNDNSMNDKSFLFDLNLDCKTYLKEGMISDELRKNFKENNNPISTNAIILKKDNKNWIIKDKDKIFQLNDKEDRITVLKPDSNEITFDIPKDEKSKFSDKIKTYTDKVTNLFKVEKSDEITDKEEFMLSTVTHFIILIVVILFVDLAIKGYMSTGENSLNPLQEFEAKIVYHVQNIFGIPVELKNSTTLRYDNSKIEGIFPNQVIGPECTGLHEIIFIMLLVLGTKYIPWKVKIKWASILGGILFIENLLRIILLYPLAVWKGARWEDRFHYYFWQYGQYMIVMTLFILWFYFVGLKEADKYWDRIEKEKSKETSTS